MSATEHYSLSITEGDYANMGWRQFIEQAIAQGAQLRDEYGRNQNTGEFWGFVDGKRTETRGPDADHRYRHGERESEWVDAEGYRFCDNEFS